MASRYDPEFDRAVMAGPIVDNAGHLTVIGELEYDGPVCAGGCGIAVEDDGDDCCEDCAGRCPECGRDVSKPGLCHDCDVQASYVGGLPPRFGAQL